MGIVGYYCSTCVLCRNVLPEAKTVTRCYTVLIAYIFLIR